MHYLDDLVSCVEETHKGLGRISAFCVLSGRAQRCTLIVAPSGTGKSTVEKIVIAALGGGLEIHATTGVGLANYREQLSGCYQTVFVDDLGGVRTYYARLETLVSFAELTYGHKTGHSSGKVFFEIDNFFGGTILAIQPVILKPMLKESQWEANINDKVTRYYHFQRPTDINIHVPEIKPAAEVFIKDVVGTNDTGVAGITRILRQQHGPARALEFAHQLVKSAAALDGRKEVDSTDIEIVEKLCRPLAIEVFILRRAGFEDSRQLDSALIYLLTEWITHGEFTLKQLQDDYKLSQSTAYSLMEKYKKLWTLKSKSPTVYVPSNTPIFAGEKTTMLDILEIALAKQKKEKIHSLSGI